LPGYEFGDEFGDVVDKIYKLFPFLNLCTTLDGTILNGYFKK
jgi:hypothetical protein